MEGIPSEIVVDDLGRYRTDWWALALLALRSGTRLPEPVAAVRPRNTQEVAEVLRIASSRGMPVVTRGGGSGVCGGAQASEGCLVVDMTAMDRIAGLDEASLMVHAEAGIMGPDLEAALDAAGATLGHIPQSFHLSTLGGWIATKATGQLSTRYGGIEDRLLGLTAVLPDGTVASAPPQPRRSAGPDWWRLFLGSEGTLGVVTEAWLEAFPVPGATRWSGFGAGTFEEGLTLLRRVMHSGLRPSVARLYDDADAALTFGSLGISGPTGILRFEGAEGVVEAEKEIFEGLVSEQGGVILGAEPGEHWWDRRFHAAEQYRTIMAGEGVLGPHGMVDTMEVAAPWSGLPELYRGVRGALEPPTDGVLAHASHLYLSGANIYFTFLISSASDDEDAEHRYRKAWEAGMQATLSLGGTISHHHGVGLLKGSWMRDEVGSGMDVLRRIKAAMDPRGLMNPGKTGL